MGYPDNALADGEHVVLHRHPHWKQLVPAVLALLVVSALAAFVAGVVSARQWEPVAKNVISAVVGAIWLVLVGWLVMWPALRWLATHFVITDRRVMFRHGVLARSGIDIALARISHVGLSRRLTDRMLCTGTLIVESASCEPLEFYDVPRVEQVHALLYQEVFDTAGGGPESPGGSGSAASDSR